MSQLLLLIVLCVAKSSYSQVCDEVEIVSRESWGATQPVRKTGSLPKTVKHVFIAHTQTPECIDETTCRRRMIRIQNYQMKNLGWPDIAYNFVIGGDGCVYEAGGWRNISTHTEGWNMKSLGIAFIGNFAMIRPTPEMLKAARGLVVCGIKKGFISRKREVHGERDATCTTSPGDALYDFIKTWPGFKGGPLPGYKCGKT